MGCEMCFGSQSKLYFGILLVHAAIIDIFTINFQNVGYLKFTHGETIFCGGFTLNETGNGLFHYYHWEFTADVY